MSRMAIASWRRCDCRAPLRRLAPALEKAKVVLDPARRRDIILHDARDLALAQGLELVEDEALLHEVAGLVEWPVVLIGEFDAAFLDIPPEVIRATIRANQKCFVLNDAATGKLANKFALVANIEASDGGAAIAAGNGRVVRARLSDAKFFWDTDRRVKLEDRLEKLDSVVFHEKLGTQRARVERLIALAKNIAPYVGADVDLAGRAALLAKADLSSEMVGEFPELQGLMGGYYARAQGEAEDVAEAIADHYKPQGPNDRIHRAGRYRRRARRQDRHSGRLLGDRREADRQQGPLRVAPRRARRHRAHSRE